MKTYDCFTFFNELELLDIRLNTLKDVVDYFVIVESNKTFTYNDKPLYYSDNKDKFKSFQDKIIHIVVDLPSENNCWGNEHYQRNAIMRGLIDCKDNDIIMVSDLDEIPNPSEIQKIKDNFSTNHIYTFLNKLYYYFINVFDMQYWKGTKLSCYRLIKEFTIQDFRIKEHPNTIVVVNGGWHFSYLCSIDSIKYKIESFSHFEVNTDTIKDKIEYNILNLKSLFDKDSNFRIVDIDETYPKYILDNLEKFNHLIKTK